MTPIKLVWLVEDDAIFVYLTIKIMDKMQFAEQIEVYENGQQAIEQLRRLNTNGGNLPQVIFLDLSMPVLDGWGFLDEYGEMAESVRRNITLYVLSSSISPQDIVKAKENSEINDFIIKPISKERLIQISKNNEIRRHAIEVII